jgi:protein-disulfide isomerase
MIAAALALAGLSVVSAGCGEAESQAPPPQRPPASVVAEVNGQPITLDELEKGAGGQLLNLSIERQRILEATLDRMLAAKVVTLEATARGSNEARLIQENVFAKLTPPTDGEVEAYFTAHPELASQDRAKITPQVRQWLFNERRQTAYREYAARLRAKYGVKTMLEPLRLAVDEAGGPARGPAEAPVTMIEFSDFECPYCRTLARNLAEVSRRYGDQVRLVFRHFPIESIHKHAMGAAKASVCAGDQGKFWEMHDLLFEGGGLAEADLLERAARVGLQKEPFQACVASQAAADRVKADVTAAAALGLSSTPTLFVNGRPILGAAPAADIARIIDDELRRRSK